MEAASLDRAQHFSLTLGECFFLSIVIEGFDRSDSAGSPYKREI